MPVATEEQRIALRYHQLSPTPGHPLTKGKPNSTWFTSTQAEGYIITLLETWARHHPEAAEELVYIANEAKWSTGWKGFGRSIEELA